MKFLIFINILSIIVFSFPCSVIGAETEPFKIQKFIAAFDFFEGDIPFIASHFEIIDTHLRKANQVKKIKNLNPFLKAIFYDNALTHRGGATQDWYVRDAKTGSRLVNKEWGWYLMDIGNSAYRSSLANSIRNNLAGNPIFDGVLLDDVWGSVSSDRFFREGTKEQGNLPLHVIKYWHDNMKLLLIQTRMAIGNKLLIINTGAYNTDYLAISNGQVYEAFCHANWQPFGEYYPEWQKKLDKMIAASNYGKVYIAQSGILDGARDSEIRKTERYCFVMFLLGANTNSYFYFKPSMKYQGVTYFPEWDVDIGSPIEDYHSRTGTPIFEREYSKGLVLINPSSESVQINLGERYKNFDGNIIDTVTLGSHEGEILIKRSEN